MKAKNRNVIRWSRLFGVTTATLGLTVLTIWLALISPAAAGPNVGDDSGSFAAKANNQVISMTVETPQTPVVPGDIVTYTIDLTNPSSVTIPTVILSNTLPSGLKLAGSHGDDVWLQEVVSTVTPLRAMVRRRVVKGDTRTILGWMGSLGNGSALRISYRAQVQACYDPDPFSIHNEVSMFTAGEGWDEPLETDILVHCYPSVDPLKINVSLGFKGTDEELQALVDWLVVGNRSNTLQIVASNTDTNPAVLGLVGIFPSRDMMARPYLDSALAGYRVPHLGYHAGGGEMDLIEFQLTLGAGETRSIDIPYAPVIDLPGGTELVNKLGYCVSFDGLTCPGAIPDSPEFPPSIQWVEPVTVTVEHRDLGDAPDSTNYAAAAMEAYPGVQANFPTVFAPSTGSDQGPAHKNPRPFHLGRRVSPEAEADVGPDMDPTNNILPATGVPDRDERDDGVRAPLTPIQECERTVLPVRVAIRPGAVTYFENLGTKGYLNVWIDGNHDGDWADSITCTVGGALEHVVIDHEIDVVALGAGLHTIMVQTGRVPWSAQSGQAAWVRVTLSESKSNKPLNSGGVDHGDGRGFATPFVLGETEDFIYRPSTDPLFGPDMDIEMTGFLQRFLKRRPKLPAKAPSVVGHNFEQFRVEQRTDYEQVGNLVAEDVSLTQYIPSAFVGEEKPRIIAVPAIPDDHVTFDNDRITWQLGDLEPGEGGVIFVSWTVGDFDGDGVDFKSLSVSETFTSSVVITCSNDVDLSNNTAQAVTKPEPSPPTIGFRAAESGVPPYDELFVQRGTTCSSNIVLGGRGDPGDILTIIRDGSEIGSATVAADGSWIFPLTLPEGRHHVGVFVSTRPEFQASTSLVINLSLGWDPSSFRFTDSKGNTIHPVDGIGNGSQDASGWVAQLRPGETYNVSLRFSGGASQAEKANILVWVGATKIILTDDDEDDIYEGTFTTPEIPTSGQRVKAPSATQYDVELSILSGQVESIFGGTVEAAPGGVVYDVNDANPVEGAMVAAFTVVSDSGEIPFAYYNGWFGEDYGQTNPQTTTVDGTLSFWAPPGTYRLDVSHPDYQPYRSQDIAVVGNLLYDDITLTPVITQEADYVVSVDGDGFDPAVLWVPPGAVVQWVNVDVQDHTATSVASDGSGTIGTGGWDSGVLAAGELYLFQLDMAETYVYQDGENPSNTGLIIVDPDLIGAGNIYLPLVLKNS
ncbi:MAG: DUF11 domain-containing protein [Chloroflexi bacterium]|nr:DUF11 domain-containing protein [Chloroflexota bacterium]